MESRKMAAVASRDTVLGLKLAGVSTTVIAEGKEAVDEVMKLAKSKKFNLIIAEESITKYANQSELILINTSTDPLIILIPSAGEEEGESIEVLAKRILGVDISKFGL